jgi:ABC-type multidrug transport system ATPase subunit
MRRRLDLAGALVATPPVLFLDEPTTGLDPRSRLGMWDVIRELTAGGTTLLLTTQYLEEADQLARDVLVIDHGRAIARGTPDELKAMVGGERIEIVVRDRARIGGRRRGARRRTRVDEVRTDAQTGLVGARRCTAARRRSRTSSMRSHARRRRRRGRAAARDARRGVPHAHRGPDEPRDEAEVTA